MESPTETEEVYAIPASYRKMENLHILFWLTIKAELAHNLAIVFWISANSYWMMSEFFGFDTMPVGHITDGKHLAIIPFGIGLAILLYYYLVQRPREMKAAPL
jgi:hypothetical protein